MLFGSELSRIYNILYTIAYLKVEIVLVIYISVKLLEVQACFIGFNVVTWVWWILANFFM